MGRFLRSVASLQLTVALVLVLGVVLAAATIVESLRGTEAARAIYGSPWFYALLGLFALNVVAALLERWPQNRWRVGFAITHVSLLVILAGAVATALFKVEGQLALWEGQQSNAILVPVGDDPAGGTFELPFALRLDAFEIDVYPGTRRPAMFRSRVTVLDGGERDAVIQMNEPLAHRGFHFFQSSYRQSDGREMSILAVSRDPGELWVFIGYFGLIGGMIVVFATRLIQARAAAGNGRPAGVTAVALALALALGGGAAAGAAEVPDQATVDALRGLPVQHDGRTMPFDTEARESVRAVTGLRAWPGLDPVAMTLGWAFDPQGWSNEPVVEVGGDQIAGLAGLPAGTRYASFGQLAGSASLMSALNEARARRQAEQPPAALDKDLLALEERLLVLDGFFRGDALRTLPAADPVAEWGISPATRAADLVGLEQRLREAGPPAHYPGRQAIARELGYNARRPARLAWILLLAAAIAAAAALGRDRWRLRWVAMAALLAGFGVMTWSLAVRWQIAGRIPASNMYESMLFLGWGVGLFGVVAVLLRSRQLMFNAAAMAALAMALVDLLPMDPFIHPMPPVLSGTPWLAIHVPIIMVSYSVFAIVTLLAHLVIGAQIFAPQRTDLSARWSTLLYYYVHVGSILLITGILTGSMWAASSWGRYWGWDPKEVWSLVAFLAYMTILHARFDGQIRDFGVAAAAIGAFWTILMTYLGVNFVLASGLHSYGFGSSRMVTALATVAAVEGAFLVAGWLAYRKRRVLPLAG